MKMSTMIKTGFVLCIGILFVMAVQAAQDDMKGMAKTAMEYKQKSMQGCAAECVQKCDKNITDLSAAMTALDEANKAIDMGESAAAKIQIEKAQTLLKGINDAQKKCMDKMPVCNAECPISGKKIDMMNVPENLTTIYKGQKIGFCCPACPVSWQKLTDEEKNAKLEAVMPKGSEKK